MMMKLLTDKEAGEKFCPFSFATASAWRGRSSRTATNTFS
jgi:hypothetical protein